MTDMIARYGSNIMPSFKKMHTVVPEERVKLSGRTDVVRHSNRSKMGRKIN